MTSLDDLAATVREFFAAVGGASLELPDGWFGRPFDNHHVLRDVRVVGDDLVVGLDEFQVLTLHDPDSARVDDRTLVLGGFDRGSWEWTAYGSDPARRHLRPVPPGLVRLHG